MPFVLLLLVSLLVPVSAFSAGECIGNAAKPYNYAGQCYASLETAEEVMRGIKDSNLNLQDHDWRYFYELQNDNGITFTYGLPDKPHLPNPAFATGRITHYYNGWRGVLAPYFHTYGEAEAWMREQAMKPVGGFPFTSDNLVFRGQATRPNGLEFWNFTHSYPQVPVTITDFTVWTVWRYCSNYTEGVEEARIGADAHSVYRNNTTTPPTGIHAYHNYCTVGPNNNQWSIISLPTVNVSEVASPLCQSPYTSDGMQCTSSLMATIVKEGDMFALSAAPATPKHCQRKTDLTNPCSPADGTKTQTESDQLIPGSELTFARHYRSKGAFKTAPTMAPGWRHTYSRSIDEVPETEPSVAFAASSETSGFYATPADACSTGWDDIKATVWNGSLATGVSSFAGGNVCRIQIGGTTAAYFPVRSQSGFTGFSPAPDLKAVTRPNGTTEIFEFDGNVWSNHLDASVTLEQSGSNWIYTDRSDTRETYNSDGRLISIAKRNGQVTTLDYTLTAAAGGDDDDTTLDRVTGPFGHVLTFSYNANGELSNVTSPVGTTTYTYDGSGNLQTATNPDLTEKTYHFEDANFPHHLTGISDENLDRFATWGYDTEGRAILSEHAGGKERVQLVFNPDDTTTLTLANGATRTYHYTTEQGQRKLQMLTGASCAQCSEGAIADRVYDANGYLNETQDWNGNLKQTIRNPRGLTETLIEAKGSTVERTTTTTWNPTYRLPDVVNSPKNTTTYLYDSSGNPEDITITAPGLSRTLGMTYNVSGQVLTIDGPRTDVTDVTTITYHNCTTGNECGQLHTITNALGHVTTYNTYDPAGRPTLITDPNGLQTSLTYDWRGNVKTLTLTPTTGVPRVTTMTYDDVGQLKTVSTPDGMVLTYTYTAAHYLDLVEDNLGNTIDYDYDAMGNLIVEDVKDSGNTIERATSYVFDLNNRLDSITAGGQLTDVAIDDLGNLTNVTDPNLASTQHLYDALNRLDQTTDALMGITDYDYDAHDNLETVTAPNGATTSYLYNGLDDLEQETSPDRGVTSYMHDAAGNVRMKIDARGKLTTYDYDALNRLTLETLDDGSTIIYEYDTGPNALGRLSKITDSSGSTDWLFDNFGAVTQKTQLVGPVSLVTQYGYDNEGRMLTMTYPSGKVLTYGYNSYQISSLDVDGTVLMQNIAYDPFGPAKSWSWGDGRSFSRDFDLRGLMTSINNDGVAQTLTYDAAGYLDVQLGGGLDVTYDYDLLGRVTDFTDNTATPPESMFTAAPTVLATIQTTNNETGAPASTNPTPWLTTAVRNVNASSVQLALGRAEVNTGSVVVAETVGYVAIESGAFGSFTANASTIDYEAQTTTDSVRGWGNGCYSTSFSNAYGAAPLVVGTINRLDGGDGGWVRRCSLSASAVGFTIDEDQYRDSERNHTTESVGFAAFSAAFDGAFSDATGSWAMEVDSAVLAATTTDPAFKTISFRRTYATAPIVIVLATDETPDPSAFRIRNVTSTGFEVVQVEPANADGTQGAMTLHYLAVEPGEHELPDGTRILAAAVDITDQQHGSGVSGSESWHTESFADWPGGGLPTLVYDYDANGNRELLTEAGQPYSYSVLPNTNRLQSTAGPTAKTYSHDAAGNVLSDGVHTYGYNDRGRLVDVDSGAATYVHNGLGQRVEKTVSTTTLFAYDEAGQLIGQYDGSGASDQEFVWFGGAPVGLLTGSQLLYVQTDQIGTPRVIYDGATAVWRWDSTPFGVGAPDEDVDGDGTDLTFNLRFAGQYADGETGAYYNYFRTLDPSTGRYLESDPIGLAGGLNSYAYVGGNPTNYVDPLGLARCTYYIAEHTMLCYSNDKSQGLVSNAITSGLFECENNPECADEKDKGPVPPDTYNIFPNEKPGREGWWALQSTSWTPNVSGFECNYLGGRCGFNLHLGSYSLGCITFLADNPQAVSDFKAVTKLLLADWPNNLFEVKPNMGDRGL